MVEYDVTGYDSYSNTITCDLGATFLCYSYRDCSQSTRQYVINDGIRCGKRRNSPKSSEWRTRQYQINIG